VLRSPAGEAEALAAAIREVKERISLCEICFNLAEGPRCAICEDGRRDAGLICVVEEPGDVIPMERTHEYRGRYHVLGGALSPIDGVEPEHLKLTELYARVEHPQGEPVREVILATNPTTTGEATALHVADRLRAQAPDVTVTRLASGLPVGRTSSTRTRSRSARRSPGAAPSEIRVIRRRPAHRAGGTMRSTRSSPSCGDPRPSVLFVSA
jgi:recombination protein RecR